MIDFQTSSSLVVLAVLVGLAQAGGIGGGPIISPVMMVLMGLGQRKAIWNTYIMMFGGSIGSFIKTSRERVTKTIVSQVNNSGAPLIDYKLVLITLPLLLSGAVVGVALGKSFPKFVVGVILFGVLSQVIYKTLRIYSRARKLELAQLTQSISIIWSLYQNRMNRN